MENLRVAVIGCGNIGSAHASAIAQNKVHGLQLTAVCDLSAERLKEAALYCPGRLLYTDYRKMLSDRVADVAVIATPHYEHSPIACDCFAAGLHVLSEKPGGVYTRQVEKMIRASEKSGRKFGVMFNQRTDPIFKTAADLLKSGKIGTVKRAVWMITNWYRTEHYYRSGGWRATWSGEGGGVLLNQAPHNLDLLVSLLGMPKSVWADCRVGAYHAIEVEDDATLYLEYENGATAVFITSTGEYPGTNRLEISGSKGKMVLENGQLRTELLDFDEPEYRQNSSEDFCSRPVIRKEIPLPPAVEGHLAILQNFADAILRGEKLIAPGKEALWELTVSNAAYLSSWLHQKIDLPIDAARFEQELQKHIAAEKEEHREAGDSAGQKGEYQSRWQPKW